MKPEDFDLLSTMLRERSGLVLNQDKVYLLESRLMPLARRNGYNEVEELVREVRTKRDEKLMRAVTEAMTTNESFFFRDTKPFDIFRDYTLPQLIEARADRKQIRIWCAAASTGQEPYSLAMILKEAGAKLSDWRIDIIATDLSTEVLEKAKVGLYSQFEVQRGLPIQLLIKYFEQQGDVWQIDPAIRAMVEFKELNLLDNFSHLGQFDIVFCRNVLIYFDQETKASVLDRVVNVMAKDGTLVLGAAETVIGVTEKFKPVTGQRGLYMVVGAA